MIRRIFRCLQLVLILGFFSITVYSAFPDKTVDPGLIVYFEKAKATIDSLCTPSQYSYPPVASVRFAKLEQGVIGLCTQYLYKWTIEIDPGHWDNLSELERIALLRHEMAHCMLGKNHVKDPNNYMYEYLPRLSEEVQLKQFIKDINDHCNS